MAQQILSILGGSIGHLCKSAETGNIYKIPIPAEASHIHCKRRPVYNIKSSPLHILRDLKADCKIIGRTRRNIPQWRLILKSQHPADGFI